MDAIVRIQVCDFSPRITKQTFVKRFLKAAFVTHTAPFLLPTSSPLHYPFFESRQPVWPVLLTVFV